MRVCGGSCLCCLCSLHVLISWPFFSPSPGAFVTNPAFLLIPFAMTTNQPVNQISSFHSVDCTLPLQLSLHTKSLAGFIYKGFKARKRLFQVYFIIRHTFSCRDLFLFIYQLRECSHFSAGACRCPSAVCTH